VELAGVVALRCERARRRQLSVERVERVEPVVVVVEVEV
jgi:hypothetical protein